MEVTAIAAGKELERRLLLVQFSKAPSFQTVQEVQANTSRGARAIVRLVNPQHITHVSAGWCAGFESDSKQFVGRSLKGLNGPATDQRIVQRMMKKVSRCLTAEETFVAYCLNGSMKLVNLRCRPLQSESGEVDHFCVDAVMSEVKTLRHAMSAPCEEPSLTVAVESRNILHASDAFLQMMNLDVKSLEDQSLTQFINDNLDGATLDAALSDAAACVAGRKRSRPLLLTLFNKDNKPVVAKALLVPLLDAKFTVSHIQLTLTPVNVLTYAAACAPVAGSRPKVIAAITPEAVVRHASADWCSMYGYAPSEMEGHSLSLMHDPAANPETLQEMMDKVSAGKTHEFSLTTFHRDGSSFLTTLRATPVLSETGRLDLCMAEVLDIQPEVVEEEEASDEASAEPTEYPITPTGHITHINGYTQLVLYPKADPTLEHCIDYLEHLRDASIVRGWKWDGDALRVNVDTRKVLNHTHKSPWCRKWTPNLRTWDAWWNRMLWVVGEASRRQHAKDESDLASDLDFLGGLDHTMPALDDLFNSSDFRRIDDSSSPSNATEEGDYFEDLAEHSSPSDPARACLSAPPVRPETINQIALQRLEQSALYPMLAGLGEELEERRLDNPVCVLDADGQFVFINEVLLELTGYSEGSALGLNWAFLTSPETSSADANRLQRAFEKPLPGKDVHGSVMLRHKDGNSFWASLIARPTEVSVRGAAQTVWCTSIEDVEFIIEAVDDGSLEYDTYMQVAKEELALEQQHAIALLANSLRSIVEAAPEPTPYTRATLTIAAEHAACIECLWALKSQGRVRAWTWDDEALSVEVAHGMVPLELAEIVAASHRQSPSASSKGARPRSCSASVPVHRAPAWCMPAELEIKVKQEPEEEVMVKVEVNPPEEVKEEELSEIEQLQAQVAALQLQLAAKEEPKAESSALAAKCEEVQQLQQELETERAVNSAALSALGRNLPAEHHAPSTRPGLPVRTASSHAQLSGRPHPGSFLKESEFVALSGDGQRQYLRQVEAAHAFLHEQLGLDKARVWSPALLAEFDAQMGRRPELQSGFCLCDDLGGVVWSNAAFLDVTGFSAKGAFGCQWISLLCGPETDEEDLAQLQAGIDKRELGEACLFGLHEDGTPLWLQVRQHPTELRREHGGASHACFVLAVDDVTPIMDKILRAASGAEPEDAELTVRAANVVAKRQHEACAQGSAALNAMGLPRFNAHVAAPRQSAAVAGSAPEEASARTSKEVLLLPGADAAEVMLSRVLWRLRAKGVLQRWTWEADLSLRLWVWTDAWSPKDLTGCDAEAVSAMSGSWKSWWRRLHAAAVDVAPTSAVLTPQDAVLESAEARVMCAAREPWMVLEINPAMQRLSGFSNAEVKGRSLCMMQGMLDWPAVVRAVHAAEERVKAATSGSTSLSSLAVDLLAGPATVVVKTSRKDDQAVESRLSVVPVLGEHGVEFICAQYQPTAAC